VHALDRHPDVVLACGNCQPIGPTARPLGTRTAPFTAARRPEDGFLDLFERSEILIFGLFRADALAKTSLHRKYYGSDRTLIAETALLGPLVRVPGITLYNRCHPARSNIIEDKRLRALWQATDGSNRRGLEHCHLVSDLFSIAWAQHQPARFFRTLTSVLWWAAKPRQILRLALELIGLVSPGAQMSLRSHAWRIIHKAKRAHPPAALRRRCAK
jgi:hypothetical protein